MNKMSSVFLSVCLMLMGAQGYSAAPTSPGPTRTDQMTRIERAWEKARSSPATSSVNSPKDRGVELWDRLERIIEAASAHERDAELHKLLEQPDSILRVHEIRPAFVSFLARTHDRAALVQLLASSFPRYVCNSQTEFWLARAFGADSMRILVEAANSTKDAKNRDNITFALSSALKHLYGFKAGTDPNLALLGDDWWRRVRADNVDPKRFFDRVLHWCADHDHDVTVDYDYAERSLFYERGELFKSKSRKP